MANILTTDFDYTYPGELSDELFYAPVVTSPMITDVFRVIGGVKLKRQLMLPNALAEILREDAGCNNSASGTVTIPNRTLEVAPIRWKVEQCWDAFKDNYLVEKLDNGVSQAELGTYITQIVVNLIQSALIRDSFKLASFGVAADADPFYGSGTDGLFQRLIDGIALSEVIRPSNGTITVLNQTAGTRALDYMRGAQNESSFLLKSYDENQKVFLVTGNVYENLLQTYQDLSISNGGLTQETINGFTELRFNGYPVKKFYAWDNALASVTNPFNLTIDTAIIFTTMDNHVLSTPQASDLTGIRQWFDEDTEQVKWRGAFRMGYNYIHGGLTTFSYGKLI